MQVAMTVNGEDAVLFPEQLPGTHDAFLRELLLRELRGPRRRIEPGILIACRQLGIGRRFDPELHGRGALPPQLVHEDPVHHAQRPRP